MRYLLFILLPAEEQNLVTFCIITLSFALKKVNKNEFGEGV